MWAVTRHCTFLWEKKQCHVSTYLCPIATDDMVILLQIMLTGLATIFYQSLLPVRGVMSVMNALHEFSIPTVVSYKQEGNNEELVKGIGANSKFLQSV